MKLNIKKKTSYILVNKKFTGKICILTFGIERKSIFARAITRSKVERKSKKKRARLQLVVPIEETIERRLGNESLEENFCILAEPEGYSLS